MLDHVTFHVPSGTLGSNKMLGNDKIVRFMAAIGYREVIPNDPLYEHDLMVRWFTPAFVGQDPVKIHLVETDDGEEDLPRLGHICIRVSEARVKQLSHSKWCCRNSGSGRIWMQYANIRVEVRP